jgi:hypothetical protein
MFRTAAPVIAKGPRKGEPSSVSMRNGFRTQPARLVRGSSRRIMSMRFRPANIRVINRRASSLAVIGPAVPTGTLRAHPRERVPSCAAHRGCWLLPQRCSPSRVRSAALPRALACCAPFWPARQCDGRLRREHFGAFQRFRKKGRACFLLTEQAGPTLKERPVSVPLALDRSLHIRTRTAGRTAPVAAG